MASLRLAHQRNYCDKASLIALQNQIVDPHFKSDDYRDVQNFVGQTISYQRELIHYGGSQSKWSPNIRIILQKQRLSFLFKKNFT